MCLSRCAIFVVVDDRCDVWRKRPESLLADDVNVLASLAKKFAQFIYIKIGARAPQSVPVKDRNIHSLSRDGLISIGVDAKYLIEMREFENHLEVRRNPCHAQLALADPDFLEEFDQHTKSG